MQNHLDMLNNSLVEIFSYSLYLRKYCNIKGMEGTNSREKFDPTPNSNLSNKSPTPNNSNLSNM